MKTKKTCKRLLSFAITLSMLIMLVIPASAAQQKENGIAFEKVDNSMVPASLSKRQAEDESSEPEEAQYGDTDIVRVSIILEDPSTIEAGYSTDDIVSNDSAMEYRDELQSRQDEMTEVIENTIDEELDVVWNLTLAANLISAYVEYGQIAEIEALAGVDSVVVETNYEAAVAETAEESDPQMATSSSMIGSNIAYQEGYTGAGSRIAIIDTGIDTDHQSFDDGAYEYALQVLAEKAGMDYDEYVESLNLLTAEEISQVADYLNASFDAGFDAERTYLTSKLPYAYNYIDNNYLIDHDHDTQGEHGSHVAGIAAANSYIPNDDGTYSSALETVLTQGVAPEAQILTMKVFGEGGGAYDSDMMASIEDAILLGCDSINLSIGSSNPGFSSTEYQTMLESVINSDAVVCISSGNYGAWSEYSYNANGYLYADDVSMQTNGTPGSYTNSLNVASVENSGFTGTYIGVGDDLMLYTEATGYGNEPLSTLGGEQGYILIDGYGESWEFEELADVLQGKIAICSRGAGASNLYFYNKAENAVNNGAIATIVYNNVSGTIVMDLTGYTKTAPCVSITQADAEILRQAATPVMDEDDHILYYEGTMRISEDIASVNPDTDYYTMSDFSSWGVPGSLEMKPEITAPGGNIYSVNGLEPGGTAYETMSGTSMASPQVAGMSALMAQYIKANGLKEQTGLSIRALSQSLLMSTAEPLYNEESGGNYYPVIQQGAGLANVGAALTASSYILMNEDATDSYADGKVKAELGDDPDRTGEYTFSFTINNLTDSDETYDLSADLFTQDLFEDYINEYETGLYMDTWTTGLACGAVWTVDGKTLEAADELDGLDFNGDGLVNANDGQALLDYATGARESLTNMDKADLDGDGRINSYDSYLFFLALNTGYAVVPANGSVEVQVTLTLTDGQKETLKELYPKGAYIEGYVYATALTTPEGVAGTSHSIPVLGFYGNWSDPSMYDVASFTGSYYGEETRWSYLGNWYSNYVTLKHDGESYYYGGNPICYEEYDASRNAISVANGDTIYQAHYALIRNAIDGKLTVTNTTTGEVEYEKELGTTYSAFYDATDDYWWYTDNKNTMNYTPQGAEGDSYVLTLTMAPEYYLNEDGSVDWEALGEGATLSIPFTIDNTAPEVTDIEGSILYSEGDSFTVTVKDNQYFAGAELYTSDGEFIDCYLGEDNGDGTWNVTIDISESEDGVYLLSVYDYALNCTTYRIFKNVEETEEVASIALSDDYITMMAGTEKTLTAMVLPANVTDGTVSWSSDDETIATVSADGVVSALSEGTCTVTATSNLDGTISASCTVEVITLNKTLNGVLWDENGDIWWSEFNTGTLPDYTKLNSESEGIYFNAATLTSDGTLYASEEDYETGSATLYRIDPENGFAATVIGSTSGTSWDGYACADIAEAPSIQEGLLGIWGQYLVCIDKETGEYTDWLWSYTNNLVGIAYLGSDNWYGYDVDMYYLIDQEGNVYFQAIADNYYVYYNETDSFDEATYTSGGYMCSTGVYAELWEYNSAYYDGEYLYWSVYGDNTSRIYAIDADNFVNAAYLLGEFEDSVWPLVGLMDLNNTGNGGDGSGDTDDDNSEKLLNGVIWDNNGVFWSEFNTNAPAEYTTLHEQSAQNYFDAATQTSDGMVYAIEKDYTTGTGILYQVDPNNGFATTEIGESGWDGWACADIAEAPSLEEGLLGVCGPYLICIDKETGEYSGTLTWYGYTNNLIGIAYLGTENWGGYDVDMYYLIDQEGNIYFQAIADNYYIYYNETDDYDNYDSNWMIGGYMWSTGVSTDYQRYGSAYYDGQYLYWVVYDGSTSVLYTIDADYTGETELSGGFGNVYLAAGLMELDSTVGSNGNSAAGGRGAQLQQSSQAVQKPSALAQQGSQNISGDGLPESVPGDSLKKPAGSLNSTIADGGQDESGEELQNAFTVTVTVKDAEGTDVASTNGVATVSYDPDEVTLQRIIFSGACSYTSVNHQDGSVTLGYVALGEGGIAAGEEAATLVFISKTPHMGNEITILHKETGDGTPNYTETLTAESTMHDYVSEVIKEATCTEDGEVVYTCTICGDSYSDMIPAVGHSFGEPVFTWSEDNASCIAEFTCSVCGETETLACEVTSQTTEATETEDGSVLYTASVELNGVTYTSTVSVVIPAEGENPSEDETPEENPSEDETPEENPSEDETPGEDPSGDETPAENPSGDETPGEDPSGDETPAENPSEDEGGQTPANDENTESGAVSGVRTGDYAFYILWIAIAGMALISLSMVFRRKRK